MQEEGAGCLPTSIMDGNIEGVCATVLENRHVSIDEAANHMQISHGLAYEIIHNRQG